jgi:TPR repeat protein
LSVPIYNFAIANEELAKERMEEYYPCCGKGICGGCIHSFRESGNDDKCPFCNADNNKTEEEKIEEILKRVEANDAASINLLAGSYYHGLNGFQQDHTKAMGLYPRAAELGNTKAHNQLGVVYHQRGDMKKAKFHIEAAAMAGDEAARCNLGAIEYNLGNVERAVKHWTIGASAGDSRAMDEMRTCFEQGAVSRESINSILAAYNNSCAEMRSEARDAYMRRFY